MFSYLANESEFASVLEDFNASMQSGAFVDFKDLKRLTMGLTDRDSSLFFRKYLQNEHELTDFKLLLAFLALKLTNDESSHRLAITCIQQSLENEEKPYFAVYLLGNLDSHGTSFKDSICRLMDDACPMLALMAATAACNLISEEHSLLIRAITLAQRTLRDSDQPQLRQQATILLCKSNMALDVAVPLLIKELRDCDAALLPLFITSLDPIFGENRQLIEAIRNRLEGNAPVSVRAVITRSLGMLCPNDKAIHKSLVKTSLRTKDWELFIGTILGLSHQRFSIPQDVLNHAILLCRSEEPEVRMQIARILSNIICQFSPEQLARLCTDANEEPFDSIRQEILNAIANGPEAAIELAFQQLSKESILTRMIWAGVCARLAVRFPERVFPAYEKAASPYVEELMPMILSECSYHSPEILDVIRDALRSSEPIELENALTALKNADSSSASLTPELLRIMFGGDQLLAQRAKNIIYRFGTSALPFIDIAAGESSQGDQQQLRQLSFALGADEERVQQLRILSLRNQEELEVFCLIAQELVNGATSLKSIARDLEARQDAGTLSNELAVTESSLRRNLLALQLHLSPDAYGKPVELFSVQRNRGTTLTAQGEYWFEVIQSALNKNGQLISA